MFSNLIRVVFWTELLPVRYQPTKILFCSVRVIRESETNERKKESFWVFF